MENIPDSVTTPSLVAKPRDMIALSSDEGPSERYETKRDFSSRTIRGHEDMDPESAKIIPDFLTRHDTYDYALPLVHYPQESINALKISDLISEMIRLKEGVLVNVADVGYGTGMALLEASTAQEWQGKLKLFGIGFAKMAKALRLGLPDNKSTAYDLLIKNHVNLIEKSVTNLKRNDLPKLDIIMACNVLPYLTNYPQWETIKKLYNSLGVGGVIVLTGFGRYYDPIDKNIKTDPYIIASNNDISNPWKSYFQSLESVGCHVDTCEYLRETGYQGELIIYRNSEQDIPNNVEGEKRPPDRLFKNKTIPNTFTDSIRNKSPSLGQKIDISFRRLKQKISR